MSDFDNTSADGRLDDTQLEAAVGGSDTSIVPCVKTALSDNSSIVPCVKTARTIVPCVKTAQTP